MKGHLDHERIKAIAACWREGVGELFVQRYEDGSFDTSFKETIKADSLPRAVMEAAETLLRFIDSPSIILVRKAGRQGDPPTLDRIAVLLPFPGRTT